MSCEAERFCHGEDGECSFWAQLLRCVCRRREDEQGCCKFEGAEGKMKKLENGKGVNE